MSRRSKAQFPFVETVLLFLETLSNFRCKVDWLYLHFYVSTERPPRREKGVPDNIGIKIGEKFTQGHKFQDEEIEKNRRKVPEKDIRINSVQFSYLTTSRTLHHQSHQIQKGKSPTNFLRHKSKDLTIKSSSY